MQATIQKWGNSQGVRIPKKILDDLCFSENEVVEVREFNGNILIQKAVKKYLNLDELFEGYTGDYKCSEYDFGEDVGREKVW
jgi:antitoxin MazE